MNKVIIFTVSERLESYLPMLVYFFFFGFRQLIFIGFIVVIFTDLCFESGPDVVNISQL